MQVWVWAATAVGEWRRWNFIGSGSSVVRRLLRAWTGYPQYQKILLDRARRLARVPAYP
ncbi:hypothetical protein BV20DRAFT_975257, partial [Pilatotrama ljubarskyi]